MCWVILPNFIAPVVFEQFLSVRANNAPITGLEQYWKIQLSVIKEEMSVKRNDLWFVYRAGSCDDTIR